MQWYFTDDAPEDVMTRKPLAIRKAVAADFHPGQRVEYVEFDGTTDPGTVSSVNNKYVFVRFDKHVHKFGWDGATSQSCDPNDLHVIASGLTCPTQPSIVASNNRTNQDS